MISAKLIDWSQLSSALTRRQLDRISEIISEPGGREIAIALARFYMGYAGPEAFGRLQTLTLFFEKSGIPLIKCVPPDFILRFQCCDFDQTYERAIFATNTGWRDPLLGRSPSYHLADHILSSLVLKVCGSKLSPEGEDFARFITRVISLRLSPDERELLKAGVALRLGQDFVLALAHHLSMSDKSR